MNLFTILIFVSFLYIFYFHKLIIYILYLLKYLYEMLANYKVILITWTKFAVVRNVLIGLVKFARVFPLYKHCYAK